MGHLPEILNTRILIASALRIREPPILRARIVPS